jgi:hypothetical protein
VPGNGTHWPLLDMEVAQDLHLEFCGDGHHRRLLVRATPAGLKVVAPARGVAVASLVHRGAGARTPVGHRPLRSAGSNGRADQWGQAQARQGWCRSTRLGGQ